LHEYADSTQLIGLLRARDERPCCRATEKRDELARLIASPASREKASY
jgi:hypothetical protein